MVSENLSKLKCGYEHIFSTIRTLNSNRSTEIKFGGKKKFDINDRDKHSCTKTE